MPSKVRPHYDNNRRIPGGTVRFGSKAAQNQEKRMRLSVICVRLIAGVAACAAIGSWAQP